MLDPATIRAVAFDGYGTLFENQTSADYWFAKELLERQGLHGDHEALERSVREAWPLASATGVAKPYVAGEPSARGTERERQLNGAIPEWRSARDMWRRSYEIGFERHSIAGDAEEAANYLRDFLAGLSAFPDARETLERLDARGLMLGLLSNADEDFLQRALTRARLRFSVIQSSESLRVYKPHRAAFRTLCARLGCAPHEVLYVGDSPTADVLGAHNAGLQTAWVRRDGATYPDDVPPPNLEVDALIEVAVALGA